MPLTLVTFPTPMQLLPDGTYAVQEDTGVLPLEGRLEFDSDDRLVVGVSVPKKLAALASNFVDKYPGAVLASAYEVNNFYLLSQRPEEWHTSSQFNYGVCALLEDCPKRLLIIAEND